MNQELQKALAQFLQLMLDGVQKGSDFASQQLPLVIQEKLHYEIYSSLVWMGIWLFLITIGWVAQRIVWKTTEPRKGSYITSEQEFARGTTIVVAIAFSICGIIDIIYNIDHVVYVWVAPRVFLLEWLKGMIK